MTAFLDHRGFLAPPRRSSPRRAPSSGDHSTHLGRIWRPDDEAARATGVPILCRHGLRPLSVALMVLACVLTPFGPGALADSPGPRLNTLFPPGGQAGTSVELRVSGLGLEGLTELRCDEPRITSTALGNQRFMLEIPKDIAPGLYDLRALGAYGLSSPRSFFVTPRKTLVESGAKEQPESKQIVTPNVSISGIIETQGDVDSFQFHAEAGQRVVIECWSERLDSNLRAVLEMDDDQGRRVASNRGYTGLDPLIDYRVPAGGDYVVRVFDLTYAGSPEHVYRLDIDTGPRVEFAWPNVVEQGKTTRVTLFGRNLGEGGKRIDQLRFDRVFVDVTPPPRESFGPPRSFLRPERSGVEEFGFDFPGSPSPVLLGVTDIPVRLDTGTNHQPGDAQEIQWPCEVSGRLEVGDEKDWYLLHARRGEVLWLELYGERIGSPVDLDLSVFEARERRELLHLTDCQEQPGAGLILLCHSDPAGRWVAPTDGNYLILVRNVIGGWRQDPRRGYRLSVRREEADFQLLVVSAGGRETGGWNVARGGRALLDLVALRQRGLSQPIRVSASGLSRGLECADVWFGPGVDRVPVIISASRDCSQEPLALVLTGHADLGGAEVVRDARGAALIASGPPRAVARLTGRTPLGIGPEAQWNLTATPSRTAVSQGSVVDVSVSVELSGGWTAGLIALTGLGTPAERNDRVTTIASGQSKGWFSIQVPDRLPPGPYTFAIQGDTVLTHPGSAPGAKPNEFSASARSNSVTIQVGPGAFDLWVDARTPKKIKRGEVIQLRYRALRRNGFIGKIRTELSAAGGVNGLRARGVTFVGQTDSGVIQVVASDDAPVGRQPFLRLEAVGTVEDEPIHHVGCFLDLEITDGTPSGR